MTKKELLNKLESFPDDMPVFLSERKTEFTYGLLNSVKIAYINLSDEPGGEIISREEVIILDEE